MIITVFDGKRERIVEAQEIPYFDENGDQTVASEKIENECEIVGMGADGDVYIDKECKYFILLES